MDSGLCHNDGTNPAAFFCDTCRQALCVECDRCFHASEAKRGHVRQPLPAASEDTRPVLASLENQGITEPVRPDKLANCLKTPATVRGSRAHSQRRSSLSHRMRKRHNIKVLVVGNAKCGKSSVIKRFVEDEFEERYRTTIGADYFRKEVERDGHTCVLQLWDIAGQDRFVSLTRPYYAGAQAAVVVCDVSRPETLQATRVWKRELDSKLDTQHLPHALPIILLANKCDLVPSGEESILLGATLSELAQREAFSKWFLTSAKRNTKIEDAMMFILEKVLQNLGVLEAAADSSATQSPAAAAGPAEDQACIKLQSAEQSELPQVAAAGTCNT